MRKAPVSSAKTAAGWNNGAVKAGSPSIGSRVCGTPAGNGSNHAIQPDAPNPPAVGLGQVHNAPAVDGDRTWHATLGHNLRAGGWSAVTRASALEILAGVPEERSARCHTKNDAQRRIEDEKIARAVNSDRLG